MKSGSTRERQRESEREGNSRWLPSTKNEKDGEGRKDELHGRCHMEFEFKSESEF